MDPSQQKINSIQEIENQVNVGVPTGPQIVSQVEVKDRSVLINVLAGLGISITATAAVLLLLFIPGTKKQAPPTEQTVTTGLLQASPNIVVQTVYVNPFSKNSQYNNPFIASQNPFNTTQ